MAFQGHQYGGYAYHVVQSFDIADRVVSQACLDLHPGVECVNTLLQQLESPEGTSSSSAHTTMPVVRRKSGIFWGFCGKCGKCGKSSDPSV